MNKTLNMACCFLTVQRYKTEGILQLAQYARGISSLMSRGFKDVQFVIAVASGKGGVGKSTTAVNVAVAMANNLKLKVGLLDADVYGPSIPKLMNLHEKPQITEDERPFMIPSQKYGVACMSMGLLVDDKAAMVWRGPMVASALEKMIYGTQWGTLDVVIVDMPPGTGDTQISVSQRVKLSGTVIVTTPQDIALADARRGVTMFQKVNVPVLGIVENMSHFICTNCGHKHDIFGHNGAEKVASELDVDIVAKIPLNQTIMTTSDEGTPLVVEKPDAEEAKMYVTLAEKIYEKLLDQRKDKSEKVDKILNLKIDLLNTIEENKENEEIQQINSESLTPQETENQLVATNSEINNHK
eukprot:TRINITY_DN5651_c0_g1_i2.p1 TRINITY_DN5651_c0_g1~~TRINITY_DN5651_c0_g1_i2.p1  ORF type:complete len:355 (-),score=50.69 TRINITY_DN5651_c0_g1_i2:176-1240(-)